MSQCWNALDAFSEEQNPDAETLLRYQHRYPEHSAALADLASMLRAGSSRWAPAGPQTNEETKP